jgi:hypothetical protein
MARSIGDARVMDRRSDPVRKKVEVGRRRGREVEVEVERWGRKGE